MVVAAAEVLRQPAGLAADASRMFQGSQEFVPQERVVASEAIPAGCGQFVYGFMNLNMHAVSLTRRHAPV